MSASALNQLLSTLKVQANIFHNGQYCGTWAVDTSGANLMTFHVVTRGKCSIDIEGKNIQLSVGDAVFMPTDAPHVIQPANTNPKTDTSSSPELAINQATSYPMLEPIDEALHGEVTGHFVRAFNTGTGDVLDHEIQLAFVGPRLADN